LIYTLNKTNPPPIFHWAQAAPSGIGIEAPEFDNTIGLIGIFQSFSVRSLPFAVFKVACFYRERGRMEGKRRGGGEVRCPPPV